MNQIDALSNKVKLRRSLLKTRQSMTVDIWKEKSDRLSINLQNSILFNQANTILAFFSFRQEPDLSLLFTNSPKNWGFPRCVGKSLVWHGWEPGDDINTGAYGIQEPDSAAPLIEMEEVDLILVPCVGCDVQKYRLGYGGGYYDRLLSAPGWCEKATIGIVFDFAYLPQLPVDAWDRPLGTVITESN